MKKQRAFSMSLTRGLVVATEEASAEEVSQLMLKHDIGAVIIMKGEKLAGIVSERDITRRVVAAGLDSSKAKAREFMTKDVVTAEFKDGLDKIYRILCHSKFRHLPITDEGKVVAIASQRDVLYGITPSTLKKGDG